MGMVDGWSVDDRLFGLFVFFYQCWERRPKLFGEDWDLYIGNPHCNVRLNYDVYIDIYAQFVYTCVFIYIYMHELFVRAWIHVWDDVHGKHLVQNSQSKGRCNGIRIACLHVGVEFSKNLCSIHTYIYTPYFTSFFPISTCFQQSEVRMSTGWISDSQRFEEELEMAVLPYKARGSLQLVSWFPGPKNPQKKPVVQPQNWGIQIWFAMSVGFFPCVLGLTI